MAGQQTALVIILGFLAGAGGAWVLAAQPGHLDSRTPETMQQSAFDRVMRSQTLRCGYIAAPPLMIKDPNTGTMSGIAHDVTEALGKALSLKIEWTEEIGWGSFPAALAAGRIDAFCTGAWASAARARETDSTMPFSFQPYDAYVRAGDTRFDNNIEAINDPSVTVSLIDGDTSNIIALSDFSRAKTVQAAEMAATDELFLNVIAKKADVTFSGASLAAKFDAANPGTIRRVPSKRPLRVFGNVLFIAQGEDKLRRMLNTAIQELLSSGQAGNIITRYEPFPGAMLRVAPPYATGG